MKIQAVLAFAALAAAVPIEGGPLQKRAPPREFIGYRIVQPEEAQRIWDNEQRAVVPEGNRGRQLDPGVYLSPNFQDWPEYNDPDLFDCSVTVDAAIWASFKKAWIPKTYKFPKAGDDCDELPLWSPRYRGNRQRFMSLLDPSFTIPDTLLFAIGDGFPNNIQLALPLTVIAEVDFRLQCAQRGTDANRAIGAYGSVNWNYQSLPGYGIEGGGVGVTAGAG